MEKGLKRTTDNYMLFKSIRQKVGESGKVMGDVIAILAGTNCTVTNSIIEVEKRIQEEVDVNALKVLKDSKNKAKSKLPCALFSCTTGMDKSDIRSYSGRMILDFDNLENLNIYYKALCKDKHSKLVFVSPSGRGLKVLVEFDYPLIETSLEQITSFHTHAFTSVEKYYKKFFDLDVDQSGKNINRLCFLPSGLGFMVNEDAQVIKLYDNWNKKQSIETPAPIMDRVTQESTAIFAPCAVCKVNLEKCLDYVTINKLDLFESYEDWLALGYLCYKAFGNDGVDMFNNLSKSSPKYDVGELNNQWAIIANTYDNVKCKNIKFIIKKMLDSGYQPKPEDKLFKDSTWKLTQYYEMQEELRVKIVKDEVTNEFYFENQGKIELINDELFNQYLTTLRMKYTEKFTSTNLSEYMFARDNITYRNFIKEYVENLPFTSHEDGEAEFMKIVDNIETHSTKELTANVLKRWGIGVFVNLYNRGYYDEILVLKSSKQGLGKTTWITKHLLNGFDKWVTTNFQFSTDKDNLKLLTNKLFIYDMENTNLKKSDNAIIKKITSTQEVQIRLPYMKMESKLRRICSFIFDTNETEIYNDLTGARRYLILDIESMNIFDKDGGGLKKINYDLVWGWLYHQFKQGVEPQSFDLPGIDEVRSEAQMTNDLGTIIDKLYVSDDKGAISLEEILREVKGYYKYIDKPFIDNGYCEQQFGKQLAKFGNKRVRLPNNPKKQVRLYKIKFVRYKSINPFHQAREAEDSFLKKYDDDL
jgi:hypothetical protein